jgi:hypothetical protein
MSLDRRRVDEKLRGRCASLCERVKEITQTPVVDPRLASRVGGKVRGNLHKLGVRESEAVGNHRRFLSEALLPKPRICGPDPPLSRQPAAHAKPQ